MGGDFAIKAHGVFEGHKGALVLCAPAKRRNSQRVTLVGWRDLDDVDAVGLEDCLCTLGVHARIAITKDKIDPGDTSSNDGIGAGWGAPLEGTGLEGDIQIGAVRVGPSHGERYPLGMWLARGLGGTKPYHLPRTYHNRPYWWIGAGGALDTGSEFECLLYGLLCEINQKTTRLSCIGRVVYIRISSR
jgi:hypothetical protein